MAEAGDAVPPNYGLHEPSRDKVQVTISIQGLRTCTSVTFGRLIPKVNKVATNAEITFKATENGFSFDLVGRDQLQGKHYQLNVEKLPGALDVPRCHYKVRTDGVDIVLHKRDPSKSWLGELSLGFD
ncbi:unnamed protein product [Calicophoron daubneyi]|uniref:Uncharacterized protein n=1 Tax=Calicophoron daubneyi TaxID=300641 RepID=A0AAV2T8L0_CALDB